MGQTAPAERKKVLMRLADLIEAEALALTVLGVRDNGTEIAMALKAEAMSCAATFRYYAEAIDKQYGEIAPTAPGTLGLAAGVFTAGLSRAHRMIAAIRSGVVHVNTYGGADLTVPLSGHKQSGNGSDKSLHAIEKYQDLKTAWIAL
ncbi:aldehyde dehydrogenase family protein [Pseudosulfitobacter sp. DSM 107133]|uniref:aldehyde dehydrogenase family protein n=1 Tax=Pseudosulfitobacter sp. DSM 107133 TaxID=2883100 RepID=UPI001F0805DA|nr:aldehyde dehydrogenase family protein [Pseudosulfitobacter sp. DSM 107133]UOA25884.1 NADP/NAD-dependent aldehyde dehydrogenase PuuC [Pseudosulfitobacter sp. DSM 107133]